METWCFSGTINEAGRIYISVCIIGTWAHRYACTWCRNYFYYYYKSVWWKCAALRIFYCIKQRHQKRHQNGKRLISDDGTDKKYPGRLVFSPWISHAKSIHTFLIIPPSSSFIPTWELFIMTMVKHKISWFDGRWSVVWEWINKIIRGSVLLPLYLLPVFNRHLTRTADGQSLTCPVLPRDFIDRFPVFHQNTRHCVSSNIPYKINESLWNSYRE